MVDKFDPNKKVTIQDLENQVKNYRMFLEIQGADKPEVIKDKLIQLRRVLGLPTETKEEQRHRVIMQEIRDWVEFAAHGHFHVRDLYSYFPQYSSTTNDKNYIAKCLRRMLDTKLIERNGNYGQYRKIESDLELMDFLNVKSNPVDIWLPFHQSESQSTLCELVQIYPGNIIVLAGEKGVGKTTIAMNIAWHNRNTWDVNYFNSEMGKAELRKRVLMFKDTDEEEWAEKISFYSKNENFHDFIKKGSDKLNIVDFLEVAGDDYPQVGRWILDIHKAIIENDAICIICLQKPPGRAEGYGGTPTRDKPRLYLSISRGKIKILDAKNWTTEQNPVDMECNFKIVQGAKLIQTSDWIRVDKWSL